MCANNLDSRSSNLQAIFKNQIYLYRILIYIKYLYMYIYICIYYISLFKCIIFTIPIRKSVIKSTHAQYYHTSVQATDIYLYIGRLLSAHYGIWIWSDFLFKICTFYRVYNLGVAIVQIDIKKTTLIHIIDKLGRYTLCNCWLRPVYNFKNTYIFKLTMTI